MSTLSNSRSTTLLFSHPSARLVKSIPPTQPPRRINGALPIDSIGAGRLASTDVILADSFGPLRLSAVPDPFNHRISTLVISVGFDEQQCGAARRFVLPFRSFQSDADSQGRTPDVAAFDSTARVIYHGLGAGTNGTHGGSFWFFEDIGEEGALDRQRWEATNVGKRAIWTLWLLAAPAPIVDYARNLLLIYPRSVPQLPPFLRDPAALPCKDTYIALPPSHADTADTGTGASSKPTAAAAAAVKVKPARPLPSVPRKPEVLRSVSFPRRQPRSGDASATSPGQTITTAPANVADALALPPLDGQVRPEPLRAISQESPLDGRSVTPDVNLERYDRIRAETDVINAAVGSTPSLRLREPPSEPSEDATHGGLVEAADLSPPPEAATLRTLSRQLRSRPSDYRHSLVAVDNETGEIVVLASDVHLDEPSDAPVPPLSASSSDEFVEEDEIVTPVDKLALGKRLCVVGSSSDDDDVTMSDAGSAQATPKPSAILGPAALYRDPDYGRQPSRIESLLGDDTFAPPPVPHKEAAAAAAAAADKPDDASPSTRTSVASAAAFFSANEYRSGDEGDDDDDDDDDDVRARRAMMVNFVSVDGLHHQIESHRPELLRDLGMCSASLDRLGHRGDDDDEDPRSDVSGTTVGGPAVKLWRKARSKPPKKKKEAPRQQQPQSAASTFRPPRAGSEASVRTSRAETALESLSDDDDDGAETEAGEQQEIDGDGDGSSIEGEADMENTQPLTATATEMPDIAGDNDNDDDDDADSAWPAERSFGHCTRSLMRTEDVRSIEDKVWREALELGDLPLDAPYTHLAARGIVGSTFLSSSLAAAMGGGGGGRMAPQEFELCPPGEAPLKARDGRIQSAQAKGANYMQGGTVLIEFLAGSSRIGTSLIRGTYLDGLAAGGGIGIGSGIAADADANATSDTTASSVKGVGMLSLVPLLPQHLLRFFGIASSDATATGTDSTAATSVQSPAVTSSIAFLSDVASLWTDATGWMAGLLTSPSLTTTAASAAAAASMTHEGAEMPRRDSDAEEWEYAIPDFDPTSLASTPRPVYRRRRAVPSASHGFRMPGQQQQQDGASTASSSSPRPSKEDRTTTAVVVDYKDRNALTDFDSAHYSILHIDGFGIGRKTFTRGLPPY